MFRGRIVEQKRLEGAAFDSILDLGGLVAASFSAADISLIKSPATNEDGLSAHIRIALIGMECDPTKGSSNFATNVA